MGWSERVVAPERTPEMEARFRAIQFASPALVRFGAWIVFMVVTGIVLRIGASILGYPEDWWSSLRWDLRTVGLVIVTLAIGYGAHRLAMLLCLMIPIRSDRTDYHIAIFWHYIVNGGVVFLAITMFVRGRFAGLDVMKDLISTFGTSRVLIVFLSAALCSSLGTAILLLGFRLLPRGAPPVLHYAVPIACAAFCAGAWWVFHQFSWDSHLWLLAGVFEGIVTITVSSSLIARDVRIREWYKNGLGTAPPGGQVVHAAEVATGGSNTDRPAPALGSVSTVYRPAGSAFVVAIGKALSSATLGGLVFWGMSPERSVLRWVVLAPGVLLSLHLVVATIFAYTNRIEVERFGVRVRGVIDRGAISWRDVERATLLERPNAAGRADRLLMLEGMRAKVVFMTSTLAVAQEEELLSAIRGNVNLVVRRHK